MGCRFQRLGLRLLSSGSRWFVRIGLLLLVLIPLQVLIAFLNMRTGIRAIPFRVHTVLGYVRLLLAPLHAFLGLAAYFP